MDLSLLAWNIRGAASVRGRRYAREMALKFNPSILILLETRVQYQRVGKHWEKIGFYYITVEEGIGFVGGIWVLTKDKSIKCSILESSWQSITLSFGSGNVEWLCTAVYANSISNFCASL